MKCHVLPVALSFMSAAFLIVAFAPPSQVDDPNPPDHVVKLIFIHHSTGENWLTDGYGDLGRVLGENNYFVSDTNYGWGPDAVGDRTDIPNWPEWFAGENTGVYMDALSNESAQNSSYTRTLNDPGGENEIIMFKSCFPNSALEGSPDDPPGTYEELSISGAKYVYNQILGYFATRPDKLFVVITAPPLSDPTYGDNARAFNEWLLNDWLRENNYTLNNVVVFDFYNVLTGPEAHHRFNNGQIEHVISGSNTLYYPSGDDHPSVQGSRKATEEFVPLLNVYYKRWRIGTAQLPPTAGSASTPEAGQAVVAPPPTGTLGLVDDFESGIPAGTYGWEPYWDEGTPTTMACTTTTGNFYGGAQALQLDFNVAANSWATCALSYELSQDWSTGVGLGFYLHSAQPGLNFNVDLYAGPQDNKETYIYTVEAPTDSTGGWIPIELRWGDFHRADWEENPGVVFAKPNQVVGMAFGFNTLPDAPNAGTIWVDDLRLLGAQTEPPPAGQPGVEPPTEPTRKRLSPCSSAAILPLAALGIVLWRQKGKRS